VPNTVEAMADDVTFIKALGFDTVGSSRSPSAA
jgi:hypothetical protein